jgi:2-oxoacid dehydrogenases acyltransferase (catalytic domain)
MGEVLNAGRRWRLGDRSDGRLLRSLSPIYQMIPYIMRTRVDAHDYFEDRVDIGPAEAWLRRQRAAGRANLGYLALFMAALVRTMSQRPRLNRFVAGQRIYARDRIIFSMVLKKRLHQDSPETVVKLDLDPRSTIFDVARVIEEAVQANRGEEIGNETDRTARLFTAVPGALLRGLMWLLRALDFHGLLPRAIHRASPFHASAFVTDLGSLGIRPIYHHLYDFGTVSIFLAFGAKEREQVLGANGRVVLRKFISIKVVNDERICDGHYYASAFKYLRGLLRQPELLETPPESVVEDQE